MTSSRDSKSNFRTKKGSHSSKSEPLKWKSKMSFRTIETHVPKMSVTRRLSNKWPRNTTNFTKRAWTWRKTWVGPPSPSKIFRWKSKTTYQKSKLWKDILITWLISWSWLIKPCANARKNATKSKCKPTTTEQCPSTSSRIKKAYSECAPNSSRTRTSCLSKSTTSKLKLEPWDSN